MNTNRIKMRLSVLLLLFMLQSPVQANSTLSQEISRKESPTPSVDYVIVGVGTAGALVAKKLTDNKKISVIALHNDKNLTQDYFIKFSENAPLVVASALFNSPYFKTGQTTQQVNADNRRLMWALGLPGGGASSINAGAFCRGTNRTYSAWETIAGPNWSVNRVLNIYKELETYSGQTTNPGARGFKGPITVRQPQHPTQVALKFTEAITDATGLPFVLDYNDPNTPTGPSSQIQYTQSLPDGNLRVSSATAFLNHTVMTPEGLGVGGRKLQVFFEATALRTLWDGKTAVGVEYMQNNKTKRVMAKKGVIVCAGLFSSAFLMHSGVGPKNLLKSLNIPVKFDNQNVGQGFADHHRLTMFFSTNPQDTPIEPVDPNNFLNQIAWLPDPLGDQSTRFFHFVTTNAIPGLAVGLLVLSPPYSRGMITINSANPLDPPVFNLGILSDSRDMQLFQNILTITMKNMNAALQKKDPAYGFIYPDPSIFTDLTKVTAFIRENVDSNEHFQSHCRMAPLKQGGVVNSMGYVHGVKRLWVADDSIVPACIDGSPMASAYLIGANVAKLILDNK